MHADMDDMTLKMIMVRWWLENRILTTSGAKTIHLTFLARSFYLTYIFSYHYLTYNNKIFLFIDTYSSTLTTKFYWSY